MENHNISPRTRLQRETSDARKAEADKRRTLTAGEGSTEPLRGTQTLLESIFRAAPIGIGLVRDRVLIEVNERFCEMVGYRPEELIGRNARMLYPTQADYDYVGTVKYEQIARCGTGTVETRWKRKDGELLDILLSSTLLDPNDHSKGVTFTALDITSAKQAERRLAESEERYRSMFENAVLGVYRTTPDGQILVANRALVRMLGYDSFEELARRNLEQEGCYAPEYPRSPFKEALQTTGQVIGLESSWIRRDGTRLFVRENARVIRDEQGNALFYEGTVEDITARRKAEEELQNVFNLSLDMVCIVNINTASFAKVNPAFTRTLGYDEAELIGRPFLEFIHPDDVERTEAVIREELQQGRTVLDLENRYRRKDGSYRWLSWTSQPKPEQGLTYAVARDITEQKQAETALRESERRYRTVVEDQTEFICRFTPDRRVTFVNEAICRFVGKTRDELIGKDFAGFMPPEEYDRLEERLAALTADSPIETHENRGLLPSGEAFWGQWTNRAIFDDTGNLVEFQAVGRDVTERRRMIEALRESEERYRTLIESAGQPIFTISRDGVYLLMNNAAAAALGGQPNDLAGKTIWELSPKDVADKHMADVRGAIDSGRLVAASGETVVRGERRCYDARIQPIGSGGGSYALVILTDVTDAKRAEEALRRNEQLLREAEQIAHAGSFSRNLLTNEVAWSDEIYRIFGYEPAEMSASMEFLLRHIHPDDRNHFSTASETLARGGEPYDIEYRIIRKNGEPRAVRSRASIERDNSGRPIRLFGAIQDITEYRTAEQALRKSEERYRGLFANSLEGIGLSKDNRVIDANRALLDIFGYETLEEFVQVPLLEHVTPESRGLIEEKLRKGIGDEPSDRKFEYRILRKDGQTRDLEICVQPMTIGTEGYTQSTFRDITERKAAEVALRDSETRFRELAELLPQTVFEIDTEGRFTFANRLAFECFGYDCDEMTRLDVFQLFVADDRDRIRQGFRKRPIGKSFEEQECTALRKDGTTFPVLLYSSTIIRGGAPTGLRGVVVDITERRHAEQAVQEGKARLESVFESSPEAIAVINVDAMVEDCNQAMLDMFDLDNKEEILGRSSLDFVAERDRDQAREMLRRTVRGDSIRNVELALLRKPGDTFLSEISASLMRNAAGEPMGMVVIAADITERRRAEELIRSERDRAQKYLDVAGVMFIALDKEGKVTLANKKALEILGRGEDEIVGCDWFKEFLPPSAQREIRAVFDRLMSGQLKSMEYFENCVIDGDGEERLVAWHNTVLTNEAGAIIGTLSSGQDTTERKEAEQRLLAYQAKLKSLASELSLAEERERRRIAGDLHDHACQSLALSKMRLQAVLNAALPADEQTLRQICDSLNQTIEDVRELTFDLSSPTLYKFGLEAALEELLKDKLKAGHGIRYRFSDDRRPKPLTPDVRVLLFQSVRELLINVIKHAHADEVHLDIRREADSIRIAVGDDGVGFDVARTLSAPSGSRGVGLFNIRERLDYVGGQLEIDSRPGCGSRFTLTAPLETEVHVAEENRDGSENPTR